MTDRSAGADRSPPVFRRPILFPVAFGQHDGGAGLGIALMCGTDAACFSLTGHEGDTLLFGIGGHFAPEGI